MPRLAPTSGSTWICDASLVPKHWLGNESIRPPASGKDERAMTVRELLSKLSDFPPEREVVCYCEDETTSQGPRVFDITDVRPRDAERVRGEDGVPNLRFGESQHSAPHVLIEITSDF